MAEQGKRRSIAFAVAAGLIYGLTLRLLLNKSSYQYSTGLASFYPTDLWVMTIGFLVVVPFVMGWITVSEPATDEGYHWVRWIFTPWLPILLSNVFVLVAGVEGAICIIFAIPITLVVSSIGGITAGLSRRAGLLRSRATTYCLAVLPFLLMPVEMHLKAPLNIRAVQTSIVVHAPAEVVWRNVERVRAIRPDEMRPTWTHRIGFPLPVEATLDHEGLGGVRHASFQHGLVFEETINQWEPLKKLGFTIAADTAHIPSTTLDDHVTIGGRYFDVLDGEYRLESRTNGDILLHLSSRERLSTDFNAYAALWSDAVMRDLQESILGVVKRRCEQEARANSARLKP